MNYPEMNYTEELEPLLKLCNSNGVKRFRQIKGAEIEVEFFPKAPEPMALDPVALSKILSDSIPPDSAMLFASSEDLDIQTDAPIPKQRETTDMA